MKKIFITTSISVLIIFSTIKLSDGNVFYNVYETGVKILYNHIGMNFDLDSAETELNFDLPILNVNGNTYVPLRELAEKADLDVVWDGEENKIILTANSPEIDVLKTFEELFGFTLPETAKVLNYDYAVEYEEKRLVAKILFLEADLEYIKTRIDNLQNRIIPIDTINITKADQTLISYYNSYYSWWDLDNITDDIIAYTGTKTGIKIKTINYYLFIKEAQNGQYYLYVTH